MFKGKAAELESKDLFVERPRVLSSACSLSPLAVVCSN